MVLITAEQAAKRLNRTERTVRRWIAEKKLTASHPTYGRRDKYLIEESEVERLAQELAQFEQPEHKPSPGPAMDIEKRLDYIQGWLGDLQRWQTEIEQRLEKLEQVILTPGSTEPTAATRTARKRATIAVEPVKTPVDIPVGSILFQEFAERHGVNERTFRDHITGGHVPAIEIDKPNRPGQKMRYLTPEQQRAAIAYWQEKGTAYSTCDNPECPCHQDQDTGATLELEQE